MRRPTILASLAVFVTAYALRLVYLIQMRRSPFFDFLHLDPLYYHAWAKRIAAGDWLGHDVFEMSPLYSYLLALYLLAAGEGLWLLRLLQIGAGSVTCVLTMLVGTRLFDRRVGILAGLGCAVYGPFFFYEGQVMKEFLTPMLATGALLLVLRARDREGGRPAARSGALAGAGVLIALAALVRDNILVLLVVMAAWLVYDSRGRVLAAAPLAAGAMAVLLPIGVRNWAVGGDFVLTTAGGGEVFYIGNGPYANGAYVPPPWVRSNPMFEHEDFRKKARDLTGRELTRGEASHFWWRQGLSWMASNPGKAARLWARKFALLWNDHELPDNYSYDSFRPFSPLLRSLLTFGPVASLAWAGIVFSAGSWRRMLPAWLAGAGYMASVLIFFNFARFRLPLVPILIVFAARGVTGLVDAAAGLRRRSRPGGRALAALVVLAAAVPFVYIDWSGAAEPFQDRLHMGAAYRQLGRPADAEAVLRQVVDEARALVLSRGGDPGDPASVPGGITFVLALSAAHRDLGGALMDQGRHAEAADQYRMAARLAPGDASPLMSLAGALKAAGDRDGAEGAYRAAAAIDPSSFAARFDLATLLYEAGRYEDALRELDRARRTSADIAPLDLADYHYGMGTVLVALPGREAEAARHFTEALRLNPDAVQAGEVRDVLREITTPSPRP